MKRKKCLGLILLMGSFVLTGCGQTALYDLTEAEEQVVVNYAARIVSKFNIYQKDGLAYVAEEIEEETKEEILPVIPEAEKPVENKPSGSGETAGTSENVQAATLQSVYADTGLIMTYMGNQMMDTYIQDDTYALNPSAGKKFLILNIKMANLTQQEIAINNLMSGDSFSAKYTLDDGTSYSTKALITILSNDFITYEGSVGPQMAIDTVIMFEVPKDAMAVSDLILKIERKGTAFEINL